jgi:hypothetical protein
MGYTDGDFGQQRVMVGSFARVQNLLLSMHGP